MSEVVISPSVTAREIYDTNPLLRGSDSMDEDFITEISPGITLVIDKRGYTLDAFYRMDSISYHDEPANNYLAHSAGLGIDAELARGTTLAVNETFRATKDSLSAMEEGIQTSRSDILYNTVSLDIVHRLGPAASLRLGAANSISGFEDPALNDTRTDTASIGANYNLNEKRSTSLTYTFSNYSFGAGEGVNHTKTHGLSAGLDEEISPTLSFGLSLGVVYTPDLSDDLDWTAEANLTKTLKNTTASLVYRRSVSNSSGLSDEIRFNDRVEVGLSHEFSHSISTAISGALTKSRSKPSGAVDLDSYSAGLSVSWQPYPWMTAGLGYTKFRQFSEGLGASDLERDRAYLNFTLTPRQWRL